jgi:hypothetical protein
VSEHGDQQRAFDARFKPGVSGNPGGRPVSAVAQAIARRYTVDCFRALVEIVRMPATGANASARALAARTLLEYGYPGLSKAVPDDQVDAVHLHLLAVSQGQGGAHPVAEPEREPDAAVEPVEVLTIDMDYLPEPIDELPGAALPLWESFRTRRQAQQDGGGGETSAS